MNPVEGCILTEAEDRRGKTPPLHSTLSGNEAEGPSEVEGYILSEVEGRCGKTPAPRPFDFGL